MCVLACVFLSKYYFLLVLILKEDLLDFCSISKMVVF